MSLIVLLMHRVKCNSWIYEDIIKPLIGKMKNSICTVAGWAWFHYSFVNCTECQFICQLGSLLLSLIKSWYYIFVGTCTMSSILEVQSVRVCETSRGKKSMTSCLPGKLTWNKEPGASYQGVTSFFFFFKWCKGNAWVKYFVSCSTQSKTHTPPFTYAV